MHITEPQVFLVGETRIVEEGLQAYLDTLVPGWTTDAVSDAEKIAEVMGRICYRSYAPGLNPNVRKVREGNKEYLENVLRSGHGSVLEHASFSFVFKDVSRVFTHELVRHRAGVAVSQESLRFVRLDEIGVWPPLSVREDEEVMTVFYSAINYLEETQRLLAEKFDLDNPERTFKEKKVLTSFMRRLAPEGLATTVGWSANARALRWVIEQRTSPEAEEEIRFVFGKVAEIVTERYPNLFGDFENCNGQWRPKFEKV